MPAADRSHCGSISLPSTRSVAAPEGRRGFQDVLRRRHPERRGRPASAASASVEQFLSGEGGELHTTILATQRAELSFDLFLQMRNKVVSAYQEIMRMQM